MCPALHVAKCLRIFVLICVLICVLVCVLLCVLICVLLCVLICVLLCVLICAAQPALLIKRPKEADPAAKDPVPPAGFEFFLMTDEYVAKVMKVFEMMKFLQ